MNKSLFIGMLSGSSMDAIDVALVSFEKIKPELLCTETYPIPSDFKTKCLQLSQEGHGTIDEFGSLDAKAGELFSKAVLSLLKKANVSANSVCAIGSHGQNLRHRPNENPPFSLQIGDPNIIAERTGILTIADFRRRDLAAGGQGAPLAPGFHAVVFGKENENRVIVNIGGISNITLLSKTSLQENIIGFDTGPGNCLMDSWMQQHFDLPFDDAGKIARQGKICRPLLDLCLQDPYFQLKAPKSTGREYFNLTWLSQKMYALQNENQHEHTNLSSLSLVDIQATLLELTAQTLCDMIKTYCGKDFQIYVCGGGAHNTFLMQTISCKMNQTVQSTDFLGIAPEWVEAMLFAWLAKQRLTGKSGNCPSVTGAKHAIPLGGIFGHNQHIIETIS